MNRMSSNPSIYFINVLCENEKRYRIHSVWHDNTFILTIIDDFKAYTANVSEADIKELANKYEAVLDTYIEEIRISLSRNDVNNIIYNRRGNTFTISRKQNCISVQFADFVLNESDFNIAALNIMDEINLSSQFYQNEWLIAKKEIKTLVEEKDQSVAKLEEFVIKKKDMEHELYGKFILILNEKKMRIQYLQESLEKLRKGRGQLENEIEEESKVNGTKREAISDSDTETSVDEPAEIILHNVQIESNQEKPKKKNNFFDEEDDSTIIKSLPKRAKVNESPDPSETINRINDDNIAGNSKKITKSESPEIVVEISKEDSQNSLNFNTQDLFDRL